MGNFKFSPFVVSATLAVTVSVIICVCAVSCSAFKIEFSSSYYFVYYSERENYVSASSISGAVSDFGGAGYILEYDGKFYVTVACYYSEKDADAVCSSLKRQSINCAVLSVETEKYPVSSSERGNATLYRGNLNTLNSLSSLAYECANALDTGKFGQSDAKKVLQDIRTGIDGLISANPSNSFTAELLRLKEICGDTEGYLYSKNLRKLQIAIADTVINIKF